MTSSALKDRADQARLWLKDEFFPFWQATGLHPQGGFQERVDLAGRPLNDPVSRVRLQARQTFCFAYAAAMGWDKARSLEHVDQGVKVLTRYCRRSDGLYGATVRLGKGLEDDRADLYDNAFVLLALTTAAQVNHATAKIHAARLHRSIETLMKRPDALGYFEFLPESGPRLQNPHMHLFESSLAYYSLTKDPSALDRVDHLQSVIETHFYNARTQELEEVFEPEGSPLDKNRLQAGHHYEWVWLLGALSSVTGRPLSDMAKGLYRTAIDMTEEDGRIALFHSAERTVTQAIFRTWCQTEALKAHLTAMQFGFTDDGPAISTFDRLWSDHLNPAPSGAWIDRVDSTGRPAVDDITAATGYHIILCFDLLFQLAEQKQPSVASA